MRQLCLLWKTKLHCYPTWSFQFLNIPYYCFSLPLQIGVALYLLYTQVQFAFVCGLTITILLIPGICLLMDLIRQWYFSQLFYRESVSRCYFVFMSGGTIYEWKMHENQKNFLSRFVNNLMNVVTSVPFVWDEHIESFYCL